MRGLRKIALCLVSALFCAGPVVAQNDGVFQTPVVTVDQERLFSKSVFGQQVLAQLDAATADLAAENRKIEAQLLAEERGLTEDRRTMDKTVFSEKAAAFDQKVVAIRKAQDDKARALGQRRDAAKADFFKQVLPVLTQIVREHGAVAVLESRAVVLSADKIDITGEAIARIDAQLAAPAPGAPTNGTLAPGLLAPGTPVPDSPPAPPTAQQATPAPAPATAPATGD